MGTSGATARLAHGHWREVVCSRRGRTTAGVPQGASRGVSGMSLGHARFQTRTLPPDECHLLDGTNLTAVWHLKPDTGRQHQPAERLRGGHRSASGAGSVPVVRAWRDLLEEARSTSTGDPRTLGSLMRSGSSQQDVKRPEARNPGPRRTEAGIEPEDLGTTGRGWPSPPSSLPHDRAGLTSDVEYVALSLVGHAPDRGAVLALTRTLNYDPAF